MDKVSEIETKATLIQKKEISDIWQARIEEDAQKIEKGEAGLREVLANWAKLMTSAEETNKVDPLTGIFNKGTFGESLERIVRLCRETKSPLGLIVFDIDYFKKINDNYGHPVGDLVLQQVASAFLQAVRDGDHPARVGGEEFAALLPGATKENVEMIAERVRAKIEETTIEGKTELRFTISVGATSLSAQDEEKRFYKRADQALYEAKSSGRNQVRYLSG